MKTMTKEEFRVSLNDLLEDASDPKGELASIIADSEEYITAVSEHDAVFAQKIKLAFDNLLDVVAYVKARAERN